MPKWLSGRPGAHSWPPARTKRRATAWHRWRARGRPHANLLVGHGGHARQLACHGCANCVTRRKPKGGVAKHTAPNARGVRIDGHAPLVPCQRVGAGGGGRVQRRPIAQVRARERVGHPFLLQLRDLARKGVDARAPDTAAQTSRPIQQAGSADSPGPQCRREIVELDLFQPLPHVHVDGWGFLSLEQAGKFAYRVAPISGARAARRPALVRQRGKALLCDLRRTRRAASRRHRGESAPRPRWRQRERASSLRWGADQARQVRRMRARGGSTPAAAARAPPTRAAGREGGLASARPRIATRSLRNASLSGQPCGAGASAVRNKRNSSAIVSAPESRRPLSRPPLLLHWRASNAAEQRSARAGARAPSTHGHERAQRQLQKQ